MVPLGTLATITPSVGPSLISLYNLYPSATIIGLPAAGLQFRPVDGADGEIAAKTLPPGTGYEWTAMSYQEKAVGSQIYYVFGLALLLVYLVLAGQYESWYAPISVILAVPLSLLGPMAGAGGPADRQQPLYPDRPDAADRAVGQERDPDRRGRARAARARRQAAAGSGGRGGAGAVPADPDDVVRLHPRRGAAGGRHRRRRQRPQVDRHHGVLRHARLDLPCGAVRARRSSSWCSGSRTGSRSERPRKPARRRARRRRALHPNRMGRKAGPARSARLPALRLQLHHPLAAVLAGQQSDQGLRRILEAVDDVFLDFQLARGDPRLQVGSAPRRADP